MCCIFYLCAGFTSTQLEGGLRTSLGLIVDTHTRFRRVYEGVKALPHEYVSGRAPEPDPVRSTGTVDGTREKRQMLLMFAEASKRWYAPGLAYGGVA